METLQLLLLVWSKINNKINEEKKRNILLGEITSAARIRWWRRFAQNFREVFIIELKIFIQENTEYNTIHLQTNPSNSINSQIDLFTSW